MAELNITLPDGLQEFIEEQVASGDYDTPSDYLQSLVRQDQQRKAHERLEALLIEGLESGPASPMTDADWDEMRRRFDERYSGAESS